MTQEYELSLKHSTAIADAKEALGRAKISYICGEDKPDLKAGYLILESASLVALAAATVNSVDIFPTLAAEARHLGIITQRGGNNVHAMWFRIVNGIMLEASTGILDPIPEMSERAKQFETSSR